MTALVVIAKACVPGMVKTRLHPPYTLEAAANIAEASLRDTLSAVTDIVADRRILYFDGDPDGFAARRLRGRAAVSGHPRSTHRGPLRPARRAHAADRHGHPTGHRLRL